MKKSLDLWIYVDGYQIFLR